MSAPTITLITGSNRGIGKALLETLLLQENNHLIGTVRDLQSSSAQELKELPLGKGSQLSLIELEGANPDSIRKAIAGLNVPHLDVVIANAGSEWQCVEDA
jgi:norsolorinic acid ketoreductase